MRIPRYARKCFELMMLMLTPMAPHLAEELWEMLGHSGGDCEATAWPELSRGSGGGRTGMRLWCRSMARCAAKLMVDGRNGEEELREHAMADAHVAALIAGKAPAKVIVVPKHLVNIVLR